MPDLDSIKEVAAASDYLAVVGTTRADGSVHMSLVKAGVLDDPETGEPAVALVVAGNAAKLGHFRRTGLATVTFTSGYRWVAADGSVRLEGPDDPPPDGSGRSVPDVVRAVYVAAGGTHDDWDEFDRVMADDRRCAVFVTPDRITGNA
jgi:PPOX class probable F420-dependent enzyme